MTGDDMARRLIEAHLAGAGQAADRIVVDRAPALVAAPLAKPSAGSFRGGCPCAWHVAWRLLTGHGQWAALAPLRHRTRRT